MRIIKPTTAVDSATTTSPPPTPAHHAHHHDETLARVLFDTWAGDPLIHVASPPGAGKTRLITHLAQQLHTRAGLRVAIAAQTRVQALDVTNRIAELSTRPTLLDGNNTTRPDNLDDQAVFLPGPRRLTSRAGVVVATTARWQWTAPASFRADVLLIDEAYQCTYADLVSLGSLAEQVVMVGDPGQIAPVVTGATSRWAGRGTAPHLPAPTAIDNIYRDQVTRHALNRTWRCGPETTDMLQAFYPGLEFTSARPATMLLDQGDNHLPELLGQHLRATSEHAPNIAVAAADRVRNLLATTRLVDDDYPAGRPLTGLDLAIVTPHVAQASLIAATLADVPGMLIGTANAVQGAERPVAVIVHPMTGAHTVTDFGTDLGRTCVALSRHRAHATVLIDPRAHRLLHQAGSQDGHRAAAVQASVIDRLIT